MYTYTHLFTCWFRYLDIMYFQNLRPTRSSDDGRSHLFSLLSITMSFFITLYSLHAHIIRYRDVMLSAAKHLFKCMAIWRAREDIQIFLHALHLLHKWE